MKIASKRNCQFIVALVMIILTNTLQAQKMLLERPAITSLKYIGPSFSFGESTALKDIILQSKIVSPTPISTFGSYNYNNMRPLSADYYQKNIGLMCKMEWSFEQYTHIPLRVRLGSLDYVNHMEGKK